MEIHSKFRKDFLFTKLGIVNKNIMNPYSEIKTVNIPLQGINLQPYDYKGVEPCNVEIRNTKINFDFKLEKECVVQKMAKAIESCETKEQLEITIKFINQHYLLDRQAKDNLMFLIEIKKRKINEKF